MSRNHEKLYVFHQSHKLTRAIYQHTRDFPRDEWFGLRAQMRRAAVSVPSNLVEGSARSSERDYLRFLNIALGSACELKYLASLTSELGYASGNEWSEVMKESDVVVRRLQRLVQEMERLVEESDDRSRGTGDRSRSSTQSTRGQQSS